MQLSGQTIPSGTFRLNESLIESLASQNATDEDYEILLNELELLRSNPIELNTCERSDLEKLPFLTDFQINSFLEYRKEKGKLLSVYELQVIHGFSDDVIQMIIPFITVEETGSYGPKTVGRYGRHEASLRIQRVLEKSRGYRTLDPVSEKMRYPGSPWLMNFQYGFAYGNRLRAGVTVEKDPGEELFRGSNRGFDFSSAYVMVNGMKFIHSAVAGDYRLAFGQGLTLWNGTAPGKSSLPLSVAKRQDAIKAYTSNDENNFFRGVAATSAIGKFTLTAFISSKNKDANITDTLSSGRICFSSFQESGYHRTSSEIADEKSVRETAYGANIIYRGNTLKVGATLVQYHYNKYLERNDDIRNLHDFSGNRLLNAGVDYSLILKKIRFFGETSYGNSHIATLNGILLNTGKYASFSLLYRYFAAGYFSMNSSAFSESSKNTNEEGLYAGMVFHPAARLTVSAYADFFSFPWLKHELSRPASGTDFLVQADYKAGKNTDMHLRLKYKSDPEDIVNDSSAIPDVIESELSGIRYHIRYKLTKQLTMQNRIEVTQSDESHGLMLYHDASYALVKVPIEFDFRLAWFNTSDYDSRIYAYEQDITSGFSFSPLYDVGFRGYIMTVFRITPSIKATLRYSSTYYLNKSTIGSGYDKINGHSRNDLKFRISMIF